MCLGNSVTHVPGRSKISEITAIALANLLVKKSEDPVHSSQRFGFVERPLVAEELITLAKRTLV